MKDSTTINGLRFQTYDTKVVHIHDDSHGVKFESDSSTFKKEMSDALKQLESDEGVVAIQGLKNTRFLVCKHGKNFNAVVVKDEDMKQQIEDFIKKI